MLVRCKKTIKIYDKGIFVKGRIYDTTDTISILKDIPLAIDFANNEYFEEYNPSFKIGQPARLKNYGVKTSMVLLGGFSINKGYKVTIDTCNDVEYVTERMIIAVEDYYFINSEGAICHQYSGKNKKRDEFCALCGNKFDTIDNARIHLNRLYETHKKSQGQ